MRSVAELGQEVIEETSGEDKKVGGHKRNGGPSPAALITRHVAVGLNAARVPRRCDKRTQRWAGGRCSRTSGIAKRRIRGTQQRHQGRNTKIRCQSPGRFDYMSEIEVDESISFDGIIETRSYMPPFSQADPVLYSCLQMAAVRGLESRYPNPLFEDDLSCKLAGDKANAEAESIFRRSKNKLGRKISVRTRFFDDLARDALREKNIKQVVVLGSGMDTRFYRLNLHNEKQEEVDGDGNNGKVNYLSWIELDLSQVLVAKESLLYNALGENDRTRRYQRYRHHHHGETENNDRYLEPADVNRLMRDIAKLSSGNSMIGASVVNTDSLKSAQKSFDRVTDQFF
eukprot:jgi/Bigna1/70596/fgenesh1_pg.12_\